MDGGMKGGMQGGREGWMEAAKMMEGWMDGGVMVQTSLSACKTKTFQFLIILFYFFYIKSLLAEFC